MESSEVQPLRSATYHRLTELPGTLTYEMLGSCSLCKTSASRSLPIHVPSEVHSFKDKLATPQYKLYGHSPPGRNRSCPQTRSEWNDFQAAPHAQHFGTCNTQASYTQYDY